MKQRTTDAHSLRKNYQVSLSLSLILAFRIYLRAAIVIHNREKGKKARTKGKERKCKRH